MRNINSIINVKSASVMTLLLFVTAFFPCFSYAQVDPTAWYGDGSANEFFIETADELAYLATLVNGSPSISFASKTITLLADIDLSNYVSGDGWIPIGNSGSNSSGNNKPFSGTFNGNGHVIINLTINRSNTDNQGLFGQISGKVSNLALENVKIMCGTYCGGITAMLTNSSIIENTYVTGSINGNQSVGGIIGYISSNSVIENSYNLANITGRGSYIAGIVGNTNNASIRNSYSLGTITGNNSVGGIVGTLITSSVTNCAALNQYINITSSYITYGRIFGNVSGSTMSDNFAWEGILHANGENSSGVHDDKNGANKTAEEIFNPDSWNAFSEENWLIEAGRPPVLNVFLNNPNIQQIGQYPEYILLNEPLEILPEQEWYFKNDGTGTYYINNAAELAYFSYLTRTRSNFRGSSVTLTADIDLKDIEAELEKYTMRGGTPYDRNGWVPIGFCGTFDGNGFVIKNLYINRPNEKQQGLFSSASFNTASIRNLGVIDADVTGGSTTGIIAGDAVNVKNSFTTGSVSGDGNVGGIAGTLWGDNSNLYSTANVIMRSNNTGTGDATCIGAGGIYGCNNIYGTYTNMYSTGTIKGGDNGGIGGSTSWEPSALQGNVALNESVGSSRISRIDRYEKTIDHNYAWENMLVNGRQITNIEHDNITDDGNRRYVHGADVTAKEIYDVIVWGADHANYPTDVWIIKEGKLPILRVFEEKNDERGGVSVQPNAIPDYIMAEVTPEVPDPEKSVVVSGMNRGFQIGLADEFGAWIHEPVFPDSSEIEFIVGYEESTFTLWLGIDGVYPAVTVPDIQADEMFNVGNYFYNVEIPEGVSNIRINFPADGMEYVPFTQAGNIALLKTGAEAWLSFEYYGIQYGDISIVIDGSGIFPELGIEPPVTLVSATPTAYVTNLNGNKNDLTVTITETYSDGSKEVFTKTFSINNNAAGSYDVGGYMVYVDTKGNTQIRECYIVK